MIYTIFITLLRSEGTELGMKSLEKMESKIC
jgi:hypothetical protein